MRNRVCLALGVLCTLAGTPSLAQVRTGSVMERKVTVTFNQAPLESVLHTLRRQYGLRISYSNTALNLRQPVTLNVQNQPLRSVLDQLLRDKNIGYELVGDQIVLHSAVPKSRPAAKPATATPAPASKPTPGPKADAPANREEAAARVAPKAATSGKPGSKVVASASTGSKKSGGAAASRPAAKPTAPELGTSSEMATASAATSSPALPADSVASAAGSETSDASAVTQAAGAVSHGQFTKTAQVSFFGPLGSNGLRSGQTVNKLSLNLLAGYAAGLDGFEAAGLVNVDRDTVNGVQVAGLANVVGQQLNGFQGAGLLNILGGSGRGWQAAGLFNVAVRPVSGTQTAGLFNYSGPATPPASSATIQDEVAADKTVQAAGLLNVALRKVRGVQVAGLLNVAHQVHGVQIAGLVNVADSVSGVSIAPLNLIRHGYHRLEITTGETWPVAASLKLGGSAELYTFFAAAYDGFGSQDRRWGLGYGVGTELFSKRRISLNLDAVTMQVHEEQRGMTEDLNLHNQLRLLVGVAPLRAGGRLRIVAGPTVSILVTQRYDTAEQRVYSNLSAGRRLWLNEGSSRTRVLGWVGYSAGVRF